MPEATSALPPTSDEVFTAGQQVIQLRKRDPPESQRSCFQMKWICHKNQVDPSGKKGWTVGGVTVKCTSQLPGLLVTDGSELSLSLEDVVCWRLSPILGRGGHRNDGLMRRCKGHPLSSILDNSEKPVRLQFSTGWQRPPYKVTPKSIS